MASDSILGTQTARPRPWSIQCLLEWLNIREKEGVGFPATTEQLSADVDHSVLLRRLTEGKKPLPTPPPLSFGHPWYELIENGQANASEVVISPDCVSINRQLWKLVSRTKDDDYIVSYGDQPLFRLWVNRIGADSDGQSSKQWRLARYVAS